MEQLTFMCQSLQYTHIHILAYTIDNRQQQMQKRSQQTSPKTSNPLQKQYQNITITQLQTITADDTFPCFSCFDDPHTKTSCSTCNGLGYVRGDHPMVRFVDEFLGKNLMGQIQGGAEMGDAEGSQGRGGKFPFSNSVLTRKQCRSALESYTSKQPHQELQSKLLKSQTPQTQEEVHYNFACNYCEVLPIKGIRYHCEQCEDFDLCETCYLTLKNNRLEMGEHRAHHRVVQVSRRIRPEEVLEKFVRCGKNSIGKK